MQNAMTISPLTYRRKIAIDHTKVLNVGQRDFPVLIYILDSGLKSVSDGGHVAHDQGEDIYFTLPDEKTELPHEMVVYDPKQGRLKAWVRIPELSCDQDTELYLHYGDPSHKIAQNMAKVWDSYYKVVWHSDNMYTLSAELSHSNHLAITDELTVQAWVYGDKQQAEVIQPLVSKWALLPSFKNFSSFDASRTDGLESIGYYGSVFDGRYIYFSPQRHYQDYTTVHAMVLRYDTHGDFKDPQSFAAYDAGFTAGLVTKSYYGAAFDGRYVYFIPRHDGKVFHSRVLRYDTHGDFKSNTSWDAYDVGISHSHHAAVFDGRYLYFVPGYTGDVFKEDTLSSRVIRFDTRANFKEPSSWRFFDAKNISGLVTAGFDGGAFDGRYIYFAPLSSGVVLRYDTKGDFSDRKSWHAQDAGQLHKDGCIGMVFDGEWLYFVPYGHSVVVRYNIKRDFTTLTNWESYEACNTSGLDTGGFAGGFFDGRYVYFEPFKKKSRTGKGADFHTNCLRYDTLREFTNSASWDACDASKTDGLETIGYQGGAFDGRYFYFAPLINLNGGNKRFFGTVMRYDTVGENGSFSLRYCDYGHNGGLCAAIPGANFIVNTTKGPLSVAAHKVLVPGWHHLSGVYNGKTIKLFVDGVMVGERTGSGSIRPNDICITLGKLFNGSTHFAGVIDEVRISNIARSDDWIKTEYQNIINPLRFITIDEEEPLFQRES